jgi:solute carrier family 9 (sodium/hydrogen exchanger), member 3
MFMKQCVEYNISRKSNETIEYVLKMLSSIMETIIFILMGISSVASLSSNFNWNFIIITIVLCTIYRAVGIFMFTSIANRWRLVKLSFTDMLIMSYGGIRGAVAFALALILDESRIKMKQEFVTATVAVVFFTVFIQGTTMEPLIKYFKIKRKQIEEPTMSVKLTSRFIDHMMSFMEIVGGIHGQNALRNKFKSFFFF